MEKLIRRVLALMYLGVFVVASGCGGGDDPAVAPPTIQAGPAALSVRATDSATFNVTATGEGPLTYQWLRDGAAISGATAETYTLEAVQAADSGAIFSVQVSNKGGSVTSEGAELSVPAKVAGLILQGATAVQVVEPDFVVSGEVLYELPGDAPSLVWAATGATEKSGSAEVTNGQFSIPLDLGLGDTLVEVYAVDGQASPIVYRKTITRNSVGVFAGTPELSADVVFVDEPVQITARIALDPALLDSTSVKLVEAAADGAETEVATLTDTGDLSAGDEIEGDGVFSGVFNLSASIEGTKTYRVRLRLAGASTTARSITRQMLVSSRLSTETLTQTLSLQSGSTAKLKAAASIGLSALQAEVAKEVTALKANPLVLHAAPNEAGTAISVLYKSGIAGVIGQPDANVKGGPAPLARTSPRARSLLRPALPALVGAQQRAYASLCASQPASRGQRQQALAATADSPKLGSNKVLVLAANYSQWGENDDIPGLAATLQDNPCLDVTYKKTEVTGAGTVEDFKHLDGYGMVLISSHGDTHFTVDEFGAFSNSYVTQGWAPASSQVVIYSNMAVTDENTLTYEADLKSGRLVLWGDTYGIMPTFIEKYSGKMPDSLIYMSICRGTWNNTLANAFIGKGAKAFLGYSDYVAVSFTIDVGTELFAEFLKSGNTLADAFDPVSPKVEADDDPAEFKLVGDSSVTLGSGGLNDGGFESGTLGSWTAEGDGRVVFQLGDSTPTDGGYMAIISTGLGFTTDSGSISQTLCLGSQTQLSFQWNFFSEEFLEFVGSQYQDSFTVTIEDAADPSNQVVVLAETVDSLAPGVSAVSNSFDVGDVYATGWRQLTFAIPESLRNRKVTIRFAVSDVGDSVYDTAVLIDEVSVQ